MPEKRLSVNTFTLPPLEGSRRGIVARTIIETHARIKQSKRTVLVVTNAQLYLAIGVPMLFNAAIIGVVIALFNARFDAVNTRLDGIEQRFDDMRDLWRAELRMVEEILDVRLKHLESR